MNADVEKAVEYMRALVRFGNSVTRDHFECLEKALRDQEAEIATLRSAGQKTLRANIGLRSRAEKAEALLRELLGSKWATAEYHDVVRRITAHLGVEHE